jgi:lysophospholipase L1-like esterase
MVYAEKLFGKLLNKNCQLSMNIKLLVIAQICILCFYACSDSSNTLAKLPDGATILAFGDSLTYGTGANKGEDYPTLLSTLTKLTVINAGVPGEISHAGLKRLPIILEKHHPDLLILIHGGNDILQKLPRAELKNNLSKMITLAKAKNIPIVMLGVPEPGIFLNSAKVYEEIEDQMDVPTELSLLADILDDTSLKSDIAHPNAQGYIRLAEGIRDFLRDRGAL